MPKSSNDRHPVNMLLKFVDNTYLKDFIFKGQIHFSSQADFRELEEKGDHFIGDHAEGSVEQDFDLRKNPVTLTIGEGSAHSKKSIRISSVDGGDLKSIRINTIYDNSEDVGICSFYELGQNDFEMVDTEKRLYMVNKNIRKNIQRFQGRDKTCIIVYDFPIFKRKLQIASTQIAPDLIAHKTIYYDEFNGKDIEHLRTHSDHGELLFAKRNSYKDQKEFRFVYKDSVPRHRGLELHLGDLSDCVSTIDLTQQAVYFSEK
ncbi:conserved hypothetical protein [Oenococcus oeni]|uniref:hypothetical protein n=1 Tax=Oenococcus oeni TaxID=1247 RepID=UPI0010B5F111|nr:hypothetical protein [Oenococcus oeni]SYW03263.1 conserved hypothetical protein [Oenococcus oeni]